MNVGKSLKVALARSGISQVELARRMGLTHTWVSALANKPEASTATIKSLSIQFDMKVSEFVALGED